MSVCYKIECQYVSGSTGISTADSELKLILIETIITLSISDTSQYYIRSINQRIKNLLFKSSILFRFVNFVKLSYQCKM